MACSTPNAANGFALAVTSTAKFIGSLTIVRAKTMLTLLDSHRTATLVLKLGQPPIGYIGPWWLLYVASDLCANSHKSKVLTADSHKSKPCQGLYYNIRINRCGGGESPLCQAKMFVKPLFFPCFILMCCTNVTALLYSSRIVTIV